MMLECSPKQKFNSRGVAQKVACVVRDYEAESSNLSTPTIIKKRLSRLKNDITGSLCYH